MQGKAPTLDELNASADLLIAEKVPTLKEQLDLIAAETLPTTETVLASLGDRLGVLSTEQIPIMQESIDAIQNSAVSALDEIVAEVDEKAPLIAEAIDAMMTEILDGLKVDPPDAPDVPVVPATTIDPVTVTGDAKKYREEALVMVRQGSLVAAREAIRVGRSEGDREKQLAGARQLATLEPTKANERRVDNLENLLKYQQSVQQRQEQSGQRGGQGQQAFAPLQNAISGLFGAFQRSSDRVASAQAAGRSGSTVTVSPTINVSANTRNDATTIAQAVRNELEKVIDKSLSLGTIG